MEAVDAYARMMARAGQLSGVVPQISLILGPCGGGAAMCAALSDLTLMSEQGSLFINGPRLVTAATGKDEDLYSMGGVQASAEAGIAHITGKTDLETIKEARKIIAMLPGNNLEDVPFSIQADDNLNRELFGLNEIDAIADMRDIMARTVDHGGIMELSAGHAPEIITAWARVGGATVGLVGNQPSVDEGRLTAAGCRKAARFVRFLDCFSIPVITFVDTAGPSVTGHPQADLIKACAQLMYAYAETTAPRVALVTGNAIGTGAAALSSRASADAVYAWPGSVISPMNAPAAVQILYKNQLRGAGDPIVMRAELEQKYQTEVADGLNAAKIGLVDDIIEPAATRQILASALYMLSGKRAARPAKKHGNLPL
jgi:acetyl-CoA carboxylase carboxyltransferase component